MGIFGALTTAVTGLRAQSYALENVSGNIANSQTTAFKRIDTSFIDLIPDKDAVFAELSRVLVPGGRIQIADVTIQNPVSAEGRRNIDLWTG